MLTKGVSKEVWAIMGRRGDIKLDCRRLEGKRGTDSEKVISAMALSDMGSRLRNASGPMFGPLWRTKAEAERHCASWETVVKVRIMTHCPTVDD